MSIGTPLTRQPGETLYAFLGRRERELVNITSSMRTELGAAEEELAHVRSALRQIGPLGIGAGLGGVAAAAATGGGGVVPADRGQPFTIKELVLKALQSEFAEKGATSSEMRHFIRDVYGRDISPTSLSPQLSRLRTDGLLKQKGEDRWFLTNQGRERARFLSMYDHPTSRAAIKELQDD